MSRHQSPSNKKSNKKSNKNNDTVSDIATDEIRPLIRNLQISEAVNKLSNQYKELENYLNKVEFTRTQLGVKVGEFYRMKSLLKKEEAINQNQRSEHKLIQNALETERKYSQEKDQRLESQETVIYNQQRMIEKLEKQVTHLQRDLQAVVGELASTRNSLQYVMNPRFQMQLQYQLASNPLLSNLVSNALAPSPAAVVRTKKTVQSDAPNKLIQRGNGYSQDNVRIAWDMWQGRQIFPKEPSSTSATDQPNQRNDISNS